MSANAYPEYAPLDEDEIANAAHWADTHRPHLADEIRERHTPPVYRFKDETGIRIHIAPANPGQHQTESPMIRTVSHDDDEPYGDPVGFQMWTEDEPRNPRLRVLGWVLAASFSVAVWVGVVELIRAVF